VMEKKQECSVTVSDAGGWHFRNCSKSVVAVIDGKPYCKIHHPDAVKKREKERKKRFDNRWDMRLIREVRDLRAENKQLKAKIRRLEKSKRGE